MTCVNRQLIIAGKRLGKGLTMMRYAPVLISVFLFSFVVGLVMSNVLLSTHPFNIGGGPGSSWLANPSDLDSDLFFVTSDEWIDHSFDKQLTQ